MLALLLTADVRAQEQAVESTIVVYDVETGETRDVLSAEALYEAPNWMPDGDHLVFNSEGHLYRVPVEGGEPEPINVEGLDQLNNDHGISPDGTRLVVSNGDGHIYTLPIEGGTPKQVTEHTPSYWHGWSPDGRRLPTSPGATTSSSTSTSSPSVVAKSGPWPRTPPTKTALTTRRTGSGSTSTRTAPATSTSGACGPTAQTWSRSPATSTRTGSRTLRLMAS